MRLFDEYGAPSTAGDIAYVVSLLFCLLYSSALSPRPLKRGGGGEKKNPHTHALVCLFAYMVGCLLNGITIGPQQ